MSRTRYYIPAKHIWAALTNVLAKSIMDRYDGRIYEDVGNSLKKSMRFSYFYIRSGKNLLAPRYDISGGLRYGNMSVEAFEQRFISSYVSTAIEKSLKSAEEGSLHEVEFIKPIESGKPVTFEGYFFTNDKEVKISPSKSIDLEKLKGFEIMVGGERSYGFGKVEITGIDEANTFFNFKIDLSDEPTLRFDKDTEFQTYAHTYAEMPDIIEGVLGDLEPLIGREWHEEKGAGGKISEYAEICYVPGTQIKVRQPAELKIIESGLWKLLPS
ncbi:MAG: hypothetical protein QXO15_07975 [Nitrososphaerota archaeon]